MISVIPLVNVESDFTQVVSLDGVDFVLLMRWNARRGAWFFRLSDTSGNVLLGDTKLVANTPLLAHRVGSSLPAGELWCVTPDGTDPGLLDLGTDAQLMYVSEDSVT